MESVDKYNHISVGVGEVGGVAGTVGPGAEGGVVGSEGVGGGEAHEQRVVHARRVVIPVQAGVAHPAVADVEAVGGGCQRGRGLGVIVHGEGRASGVHAGALKHVAVAVRDGHHGALSVAQIPAVCSGRVVIIAVGGVQPGAVLGACRHLPRAIILMGGTHVLSSLAHDGVALGVYGGDCDNTLGVEDAAEQCAVRQIGIVRIIIQYNALFSTVIGNGSISPDVL